MSRISEAEAAGQALLDLVTQIQRLAVTRCPTISFGFTPQAIACSVEDEVAEVRAERVGSEAAQAEAADVLATAIHLVLAHGGDPVRAIQGQAAKLRARLDVVEAGGTWAQAKAGERAAATPEPPPTPSDGPALWPLVIQDFADMCQCLGLHPFDAVEDMRARDKFGREKYGTPLQAGNGRDALVDAYQEALDLAAYLRQAEAEGKGDRALYVGALKQVQGLARLIAARSRAKAGER